MDNILHSCDDDSRVIQRWTQRITGSRAVAVREILDVVGSRLFPKGAPAPELSMMSDVRMWHPPALANGYPGLALCGMVLEEVFPERGYETR